MLTLARKKMEAKKVECLPLQFKTIDRKTLCLNLRWLTQRVTGCHVVTSLRNHFYCCCGSESLKIATHILFFLLFFSELPKAHDSVRQGTTLQKKRSSNQFFSWILKGEEVLWATQLSFQLFQLLFSGHKMYCIIQNEKAKDSVLTVLLLCLCKLLWYDYLDSKTKMRKMERKRKRERGRER